MNKAPIYRRKWPRGGFGSDSVPKGRCDQSALRDLTNDWRTFARVGPQGASFLAISPRRGSATAHMQPYKRN